jgi:HAD superfamily hydrolase (TIGR01549 family)
MTLALVRDVDLLCLDAGNTVVFFDHARLAHLCAREGWETTAEALRCAEGETKHAHEQGTLLDLAWANGHTAGAQSWAGYVGTMLSFAGLARDRVPRMLEALWPEHRTHNLWSLVPEGLVEALLRVRSLGVRVAVVSNSEGKLEAFFDELGILPAIDLVVDSGLVGFEKPDPRLFQVALDRFGVPPGGALHLGDNFATDVLGARAAGIRVALVDPFGHLAGRHADVPRVTGAREAAHAIADAREGS